MNQALLRLWDVCIFRAGPAALPSSFYFLGFLVLAGYVIDLFLAELVLPSQGPLWYLHPAIWFIVHGLAIFGILRFRQAQERFLQTYIALTGTGLYISSIGLILCTFLVSLWSLIVVVLLIWQVILHGRIISTALQTKHFIGVMIAVALAMVVQLIVIVLTPVV